MARYEVAIEGGMSVGKLIQITGNIPEDAKRFSVNLHSEPGNYLVNDIMLHVNPRTDENNCIVRNHLFRGVWGPEDRDGGMPLKNGQFFEMDILCEVKGFKITINRTEVYWFGHRLPFKKATHIFVTGDVWMTSISP